MARPDAAQLLTDEIARGTHPSFIAGRPVAVRSAPGRLDVLGGLGADAGGTVAQMAVPARVAAAVQSRDGPALIIRSEQIVPPVGKSEVVVPLEALYPNGTLIPPADLRAIAPAQDAGQRPSSPCGTFSRNRAGHWMPPSDGERWAGGVEAEGREGGGGATILIRGDLPIGAGQASSTALLAAVLLALCDLQRRFMDPNDQAALIQRAELLSTGPFAESTGTIHMLDALTSLLATPRAMLRYSTQPFRLVGAVPVPPDVRVLALDTGVAPPPPTRPPRYTSARETLDELRVAGEMGLRIIETIYKDLGQSHTPLHGYLANTSPLLYRQYFRTLLPKRMRAQDFIRTYGPLPDRAAGTPLDAGRLYRVRTAVDHLIAENEHAEQFLQAMEELADAPPPAPNPGDPTNAERQRILQRAGRLALASHHSYRLRLELSCREADWLVDRLMESGPDRGIYGARITDCGGGGTVMALVDRSTAASDSILEIMNAYSQISGLALGVAEAGAAGAITTFG